MSYEQSGRYIGFLAAGADLSAAQFLGVDVDTTAAQSKVVKQTTAGGRVIGILQDKPTSGQAALVQISGVSKAVCGSAGATAGDDVMVDTSGQFTTATTGKRKVGVALATAVSGDVFPVLLMPGAAVV